VPQVDPKKYVLEISGEGIPNPIKLTLEDLKTKFHQVSVIAAIQCSGNRRSEFLQVKPTKVKH
jgi:DMSO/TMAO reductase YedYZ molybdopterin-dependent catalytic subunit